MASKGRKRTSKKRNHEFDDIIESDETFAFIAGYSSGGFPYGVTWGEMENAPAADKVEDIDLPFD